jgi:peroxiredoxin (alkyl hydroperoxide reductase subunit C)
VHDLPVGRSVEETIRVVKAFQFTDEHGEVCPAGWEEGAATIDTADKAKYFATQ